MSAEPSAEDRVRAVAGVFDRGADTYGTALGAEVDYFGPAGRDLVAAAAPRPGERVLDVGCGRGAALFPAAEAVGGTGRVVGLDIAPRMVDLTAADAAARGLSQVSVAVGDAGRPEFAPGSFDVVLGALVLFFLPDVPGALRRYAELLVPTGRLAFSTFAAMDPVFDAAMDRIGEHVPGGLQPRAARQGALGSPEGIATLLAGAGFGAPRITEHTYESRFADADHWLAWTWSHGGRASLERVPADRLEEATAAAGREMAAARTATGELLLRTTVRCTVARPV